MFAIFLVILLIVIGLLFVGVVGIAFADIGFSATTTAMILIGTLVGSYVNIPLLKLKTRVPIVKEEYVNSFGLFYRIPRVEYGKSSTNLVVNVGGALIPSVISAYLLFRASATILPICFAGIALVALVTRVVARPVKGVGIVTPAFIPPIAAAFVALLLASGSPQIVAYVSGVMGTLIGADLSNLRVIPKLGAPVASIGGAGTFDGVFLSGILAVLLAGL